MQIRCEKGFTLIETLVAMAILGITAIVFLSSLATTSRATVITDEQATAESLVRSQAEYVKSYPYQVGAEDYPVSPDLTIPLSWTVPPPTVQPVHGTDDGMQKVTVIAVRNGRLVLSLDIYKVNR